MSLVSPGVKVTVIDQSNYIGAPTNSVPFFLLATAQNKVSGAGTGIAAGTLAVNAGKPYLMTSQRDLLATFGNPFFYTTSTGTPINGYELNEYGLLAAYSALGVTNQAWVMRADVDLAALSASLVRPLGNPTNGTYWFNTQDSLFGIFQWNQATGAMNNQAPIVITDVNDIVVGQTYPLQAIGSIGDYAVNATNVYNPVYYKCGGATAAQTTSLYLSGLYNTWQLVGSDEWALSWATISGTQAPTSLNAGDSIIINGTTVAVPVAPNNTVEGLSAAINSAAITGVYSAVVSGALMIYANSLATSGAVAISNGVNTPLLQLGITAGTYRAPTFFASPNYGAPRWRTTDTTPRPSGSVWMNISPVSLGANFVVQRYSTTLGMFVLQACSAYTSQAAALYGLDPANGGSTIAAGATYALVGPANDGTAGMQIMQRYATGPTVITGSDNTPGPFVSGNTFTITATAVGSTTTNTATATLTGTTTADFIAAVSAANVPYVSASINSAGAVVFTHSQGGDITLTNVVGTPVTAAGINTSCVGVTHPDAGTSLSLLLSNWVTAPTFTYTASTSAPDQDPATGTYWYYSTPTEADILIQENGQWVGYQNCGNDTRGYNLGNTNATGPIFSTTPPTTENDEAESPLVYGDLWVDTSDLENYPQLYRWQAVNGQDQWVLINDTDQTSSNGILFADARWGSNGTINPVSDPIPSIEGLLTSNWLDPDAPNPNLYPQGMLLWNTRRSGFNVKTFQANYWNNQSNFPAYPWSALTSYERGDLVTYSGNLYIALQSGTNENPVSQTAYWGEINQYATWLTAAGNKIDGSPYMGRQSQRQVIVESLRSAIDSSLLIREEQNQFNLMACPQYPELLPNMVALNNERGDTAFIVADTPLRLSPNDVVTWATNNSGLGTTTGDGLLINDHYAGAYYPSCLTNDLTGNQVVQPPSHMIVRTTIRSDSVSYPWIAAAGLNRGVVDNATQLGYIDTTTGEFTPLSVGQGLRDVLYQNAVNPITFIPGVGITVFGNKTTTTVQTAMDRVNVARLVAYLRGALTRIGKQYLFEPNDTITRNSIQTAISSLLNQLVAERGIYDYLVVCDTSNNTPATIDRNELYVDIAIEPVKAVEFIYIPVRLENTGAIAAQASA